MAVHSEQALQRLEISEFISPERHPSLQHERGDQHDADQFQRPFGINIIGRVQINKDEFRLPHQLDNTQIEMRRFHRREYRPSQKSEREPCPLRHIEQLPFKSDLMRPHSQQHQQRQIAETDFGSEHELHGINLERIEHFQSINQVLLKIEL